MRIPFEEKTGNMIWYHDSWSDDEGVEWREDPVLENTTLKLVDYNTSKRCDHVIGFFLEDEDGVRFILHMREFLKIWDDPAPLISGREIRGNWRFRNHAGYFSLVYEKPEGE